MGATGVPVLTGAEYARSHNDTAAAGAGSGVGVGVGHGVDVRVGVRVIVGVGVTVGVLVGIGVNVGVLVGIGVGVGACPHAVTPKLKSKTQVKALKSSTRFLSSIILPSLLDYS
jgi:hypothetical protein